MSHDLPIACACRQVRGVIEGVSPANANFVCCYCDDCQAFARFLKSDVMVNERGGTTIVQVPLSRVNIGEGRQNLTCMRLSSKGVLRWYTSCCHTPMGNMVGPALPFVGLCVSVFVEHSPEQIATLLGPVVGVHGRYARGGIPEGVPAKIRAGSLITMLFKFMAWKFRGYGRPSVFFDASDSPYPPPIVLNPQARRELERSHVSS